MGGDALQGIRRAVEALAPMEDADFRRVEPHLRVRRVRAGTCLLVAGQVARTVYYVHAGLLREFYLDGDGGQVTRTFCPEGEFSGSLADLLSGTPALVNIDALEDTLAVTLPWRALDALSHRSPAWALVCRRQAELLVLRKVRREHEMLSLDAAERHRRFTQEHRALDARLSRGLVASYLGISPVHLSRLRSKRRGA